ncbi:MAG: GGDEF domain-containing protein [Clostridiales bacterium]|nr:GGDEF domain-containing protein [Clostridiales bacterium]
MDKTNRKYHIMYGIMLFFFAFIVIWVSFYYKGSSFREEFFLENEAFDEGWKTDEGEVIDVSHFNKIAGVQPYKQFSVYNVIPKDLKEGSSLYYRSKNIYYEIYIDGELIYAPYVPESVFYTKSFGTRWNCIPLSLEDAGKTLEVRVTTVYDSARAGMDSIYIGSSAGIVLDIMKEKAVSFVTCVLLLFVGFLLIVADIPINIGKRKNHELLYLGLFAVSISIWCLAETNLLQFFMGNSRLLQVVSCYSLMLIPIPMILYLNAAFGFRNRFVVSVFSTMSFVEFLICMILHMFHLADLRETLRLTHIMLALSAIIMFYMIIRNSFVKGKNQIKNIYRVLRGIGLCGISVATVIDIIRFYRGSGTDAAMFVRIGLLIFILCYGSSSLEKTINAVKLGVQAEFVSQLAYRDGLTGIGNRTAFQERMVDLEKIKNDIPAVGIIMFDVNDLKYVNDNMGHQLGDEMLVQSAKLILNSFEKQGGDCFRIGGDEFVVLLSGENVKKHIEQGIQNFQELIAEYNKKTDKQFRISIAYGYALYNRKSSGKKLMDIHQQADQLMYENKKNIKANQLSPEEYYKEMNCKDGTK